MATRLGESDQDLHHFVSHSPWSADVLLEGLAKATATTPPAYWIIDETSFPKAGQHSAGVQRQYCGALGKTANCQMAVSLHRADEAAGTSQPLCWRLFLPKAWAGDAARCQRAGVPPGIVHQSKQDLAFGLLDQALGWKSPAGIVLADEAYGGSFEWRLALRARNLFYCARAVDDHRLAGGAALWRGCARAPGLSRQAGPAAQPRTQTSAGHRAEPACFGLEERHLAAGHQGAATLAFCKSARVGRTRLEAGAATRGGGRRPCSSSGRRTRLPPRATGWRGCPRRRSPSPSSSLPPKRAGASSRTTANSRMNSGWTTSRAAPGKASTTTSPWSPRRSSFYGRSRRGDAAGPALGAGRRTRW